MSNLSGGIPSANNQGLLSQLPPEIRQMIFEMLLISCHVISIGYRRFPATYIPDQDGKPQYRGIKSPIPGGSAALLRTCRSIYDEAVPILYGKNRFRFDQMMAELPRFLVAISPIAYDSIAEIHFQWPSYHPKLEIRRVLNLLSACKGLRRVAIWDWTRDPGKMLTTVLQDWRLSSIDFIGNDSLGTETEVATFLRSIITGGGECTKRGGKRPTRTRSEKLQRFKGKSKKLPWPVEHTPLEDPIPDYIQWRRLPHQVTQFDWAFLHKPLPVLYCEMFGPAGHLNE